jgi:uridine kinase
MTMMKPTIQIRCKNNGQTLTAPIGSTLAEVFRNAGIDMKYGPICAKVNNKVEGCTTASTTTRTWNSST